MSSCALDGCLDPACPVCSVSRRFPVQAALIEADSLRRNARKLAGGKPRDVRDPRFIKRKRKALTR